LGRQKTWGEREEVHKEKKGLAYDREVHMWGLEGKRIVDLRLRTKLMTWREQGGKNFISPDSRNRGGQNKTRVGKKWGSGRVRWKPAEKVTKICGRKQWERTHQEANARVWARKKT